MRVFKWLPVFFLIILLFGCATKFQREVKLNISSEPPNAKIYEEGKLLGNTPINLIYKYKVKKLLGIYFIFKKNVVLQALLQPRSFTAMKDGFEPQTKSFQFSSPYQEQFVEKIGANFPGPDFFPQPEFTLLFALEPLKTNHQQQQQIDRMWSAVIKTFAQLNLPITNMETASDLITTDWISFKNQNDKTGYCACGTTSAPLTEVDRRGKISVSIIATDNSVVMKVDVVFEKISQYKEIVDNTPCISTGKLEAEIRKRVSENIK